MSAPAKSSAANPLWSLTKVVALAIAVSAAILLYARYRPGEQLGGLAPGASVPAIAAQGWINGPPPAPDDLVGKVLVIDAWATWCGPCRAMAPHLVELHQKYADRGVVFLGLTDEPEEQLPEIEEFVRDAGITWPNGYGAVETLEAFQHRAIPSLWVVGRDGTILWNSDARGEPDEAIEAALETQ